VGIRNFWGARFSQNVKHKKYKWEYSVAIFSSFSQEKKKKPNLEKKCF
jgi:hypothetical protein